MDHFWFNLCKVAEQAACWTVRQKENVDLVRLPSRYLVPSANNLLSDFLRVSLSVCEVSKLTFVTKTRHVGEPGIKA
jgi:hypothetical protein